MQEYYNRALFLAALAMKTPCPLKGRKVPFRGFRGKIHNS